MMGFIEFLLWIVGGLLGFTVLFIAGVLIFFLVMKDHRDCATFIFPDWRCNICHHRAQLSPLHIEHHIRCENNPKSRPKLRKVVGFEKTEKVARFGGFGKDKL